jgi:hypothetical protein
VALNSAAATFMLSGLLLAAAASAQSVTSEVDVTGGVSTENVRAGGAQARVFGASGSDWRFFAEATWAGVDGQASDAFGAAYPYEGRIRPMEVYVEKMFRPRGYLFGVRGGRYRTPFGIFSRGDYGYSGFVRAPLIRYGQRFALSNTWLEDGLDVVAGTPRVYVETSLSVPQDEGQLRRRPGVDGAVRVQGYYKSLIVGASRIQTGRDRTLGSFAQGRSVFNGADARWTTGGIQVRGEWIFGRAFDGVTTTGGYLDLLVHRRALGIITPIARIERLDYAAGPFSLYLRRITGGARIHLPQCFTGEVNLIHQPAGLAAGRRNVIDAGVTCSVRR